MSMETGDRHQNAERLALDQVCDITWSQWLLHSPLGPAPRAGLMVGRVRVGSGRRRTLVSPPRDLSLLPSAGRRFSGRFPPVVTFLHRLPVVSDSLCISEFTSFHNNVTEGCF